MAPRPRAYLALGVVGLALGAPATYALLPPFGAREAPAPKLFTEPRPVAPQASAAQTAAAPATALPAASTTGEASTSPTPPASDPPKLAIKALPLTGPAAATPTPAEPSGGNALEAISVATLPSRQSEPKPRTPPPSASAYAPAPDEVPEIGPAVPHRPDDLDFGSGPDPRADAPALREAIEAYRKGDLEAGDAAAKNALDDFGRTALRWAAVRLQPTKAGPKRIADFVAEHQNWPNENYLLPRLDDSLYTTKAKPALVRAQFADREPSTAGGRLALARALEAEGKKKEANALARRVWREDDFGKWMEKHVRKEFGDAFSDDDHRYRSARLFYKGHYTASLRAAGLVNKDYLALAKARVAVAREHKSDRLMKAVPAALRTDPTYEFARVQKLRRSGDYRDAAKILEAVAEHPEKLIDGDAWWDERKMIARKLLDVDEPEIAYKVAAGHTAESPDNQIEGEFHAGWIALRFLNRPTPALAHFAKAAEIASTPISQSRAYYWQARAAELSEEPDDAGRLYALAAQHSSAYYGQLARARLGYADQPVRRAARVAEGDERLEPIRVVELFEAIGEKDLAFRLTVDLARTLDDDAQVAALGRILIRSRDARATLVLGKLASYRGVALDDLAFPTFGVPDFKALERSAAKPVVYAIARQESAFRADVTSHAGAKGLMQMLTSTARMTAKRAGVDFDAKRLVTDPAFNAQLGAAHLAELMDDHKQSLIMTFAAYNAGGARVKQWVAAYGDPRAPDVDPIDWIERIPFTETRNYVQRVVENLGMYRARFGEKDAPQLVVKDLRARETRVASNRP